ncbi:hypothetical protein RJ640_022528 [Escallonia rubra]|uniref:Receptor-like serine/threonine-protein kinase n=1 Tax=Escallonia rubra TaxID=112253 RepID=A0AA88RKU6_9ASTE|nr:hypothetical protein RJ640_022528 [Escallonia rubra]
MANTLYFPLLLLLLSAFLTATAQQRHSNISPGSSLTSGSNLSWLSPSGLYAFGFHQQGNGYAVGIFLAGVAEKTIVWTANRDDPPVSENATLLLTTDGRFVLKPMQGYETSIANPDELASSASMLDSGNFVLYNSDQRIVWQSFEGPTETLLPGQRLTAGQELVSSISQTNHSTGKFRLRMQLDGNLVSYPVKSLEGQRDAFWSTKTYGAGDNVTLNLDDDGRLYLLNSSFNLRNLTKGVNFQGRTIYLAKLDVDGIFRLYSQNLDEKGNWSPLWSTSTSKCDPKGICGVNSYCILKDLEAKCVCIPGHNHVDPNDSTSGCQRNYTAGSCENEDGRLNYTMKPLDDTKWLDNSYSILTISTKDDCAAACQGDCNCYAVIFEDGLCKLQSLPLSYGRSSPGSYSFAFFKVGVPENIRKGVPADRPSKKPSKKKLTVEILIIGVSLVAFAFLVLAISGALIYRSNAWTHKMISNRGNIELNEDLAPRAFTYSELEEVTNSFKEEIGRGSFGAVYKGTIQNNQKVVAVKRLEKVLAEGEREFQSEMKVIGRTHHRNLVRLYGYCLEGTKRLLVYEYMSNGSLANILFTSQNQPSWDERVGISLDIARGILYLHEECETRIVHCDIKPQNILMDKCRCAKISDFGLAKLLKPDQTRTFTGIRGTRGYVAPEWHRNLPVTVKADVYSFGIVLLEIICRRRTVDSSLPEDEAILEEWVYQCYENRQLSKLVGDEQVDERKVDRMVKVALWCIQEEPSLRPSIKKVLLMLEGTGDIPKPPSPTSSFSTI